MRALAQMGVIFLGAYIIIAQPDHSLLGWLLVLAMLIGK